MHSLVESKIIKNQTTAISRRKRRNYIRQKPTARGKSTLSPLIEEEKSIRGKGNLKSLLRQEIPSVGENQYFVLLPLLDYSRRECSAVFADSNSEIRRTEHNDQLVQFMLNRLSSQHKLFKMDQRVNSCHGPQAHQ